MNMLSSEEQKIFLDMIQEHGRLLEQNSSDDNLFRLFDVFENLFTLDQLEACFHNSPPTELNDNLIRLLSQRWERIRKPDCSQNYTLPRFNGVNQLCLELARALSPPAVTKSEIEALPPGVGPYFLLMPSLEQYQDIYGDNIHSLGLHEFILSDEERTYIPLVKCLHDASESDEGELRHQVMSREGYFPNLSSEEVERVSHHSEQAESFYKAICLLNAQRLLGGDIGAQLRRLFNALQDGGEHSLGRGSGSQYSAGSSANLGILEFSHYWEALSERQKSGIFTQAPDLRHIIGRLFRPNDVNYRETTYCVEMIASDLGPIIRKYDEQPKIQDLKIKVLSQEALFKKESDAGALIIKKRPWAPPKHILHHIFELQVRDNFSFKLPGYVHALRYALEQDLEALLEFNLDEVWKKYVVSAQFTATKDSVLIRAAKQGKTKVIQLLLSWGADIEYRDINQSTALHWAANNGHTDTALCLLNQGALLESKGHENATALYFAAEKGKSAVVKLLLEKNARINVRCNGGLNALEIAIKNKYAECIEHILMQAVMLPVPEQKECLGNIECGKYPDVLSYVFAKNPSLFDTMMQQVVGNALGDELLKTLNGLLLSEARAGKSEGIRKLLNFGANIESHDFTWRTALHWAALSGCVRSVTCLLEKGAMLDAVDRENNTAMNLALTFRQEDIAALLFQKNARIHIRNILGKNSLDIAIEKGLSESIALILIQAVTLPLEEQKEYLSRISGEYPNILFYAFFRQPDLFSMLVDTVKQSDYVSKDALFNTLNPLLKAAAKKGRLEEIRTLLNLGLNIESRDSRGKTALHWAVLKGYEHTANFLLQQGASLEARDIENNTAMHFAVMSREYTLIRLLIQKNAKVNAKNEHGITALDMAIQYGVTGCVDLILSAVRSLPFDEQRECLLEKVKGASYPNALFYALSHSLSAADFLDTVLQQPDQTLEHAFFAKNNGKSLFDLIKDSEQWFKAMLMQIVIWPLDKQRSWFRQFERNDEPNALFYACFQAPYLFGPLMDKVLQQSDQAFKYAVLTEKRCQTSLLGLTMMSYPEYIPSLLKEVFTWPIEKQNECFPDIYTYVALENPDIFDLLFVDQSKRAEVTERLDQMKFDEHFRLIHAHYKQMQKKSTSNSKYQEATVVAGTLLKACMQAKVALYQSNEDVHIKMDVFTNSCKEAIEQAKPILGQHREWHKVLTAFLLALLFLPVSLPLYALGFFSAKPKAEQLLQELQQSMEL